MSMEFLKDFSPEEKLILYSVFGGTAMYLQQIDSHRTVQENIQNLFLKPMGYLYEEPLLLMHQEVQEPGVYCAIIEAIAKGAVKSSEISAKTGEDAAKCLKSESRKPLFTYGHSGKRGFNYSRNTALTNSCMYILK